jgi:osmotically-inducible protein OsmY
MLGGCTAMMVGGSAGGGYQTGKDERSVSVTTSDSAITTRIKSKFAADSVVSVFDVGVRTWKGTVTLSGTVGSYTARDQAESIAKATSGVRAVNNHIVVEDRSAR